MPDVSFDEFFRTATGHRPHSYEKVLANRFMEIDALKAPTGVGKTAGVVFPWLWTVGSRRGVPRRLVYCLPQRTLLEQTAREIRKWLKRLDPSPGISVQVLMDGDGKS